MAPAMGKAAISSSAPPLVPVVISPLEVFPERLREKRADTTPDVPDIPSFLARTYGPEVPKELTAPLGAADEVLKRL